MGRPILFSKAILLTAFIPLYTLQRVEGKIFRPMALTLTFALIAGTILALTVVPVLASFAVKEPNRRSTSPGSCAGLLAALPAGARTARCAARCWCWRAASLAGRGRRRRCHFIGSEFLPKLDEGALWVRVFMPESIAPTEADRASCERSAAILASFPEVKTVVSQLGRPDDGTDVNGFDVVEFYVDLKPRARVEDRTQPRGLSDAMNARRLQRFPASSSSSAR